MTAPTVSKIKIPHPLYAVAGAGELAYEELRKLADLDLDKLRDAARHQGEAMAHRAHLAQDRAVAIYNDLVVRGERVVGREAHEAETIAAAIEEDAIGELPPAKAAKKATRPVTPK